MTARLVSTTTEPVTLAEVKQHAAIYVSDHDTMIEGILIPAARRAAEQETGRSIASSIWDLYLDEFPAEIQLPYPPIIGVTEIVYTDADGASQTLSSSLYSLDSKSEPGWVLPAYGTDWPATYDVANAVRVRYTAGYGADCPGEVKLWILAQVRHFYDHRGAVVTGTIVNPLPYLNGLLDKARVYA